MRDKKTVGCIEKIALNGLVSIPLSAHKSESDVEVIAARRPQSAMVKKKVLVSAFNTGKSGLTPPIR